jgi:methylase of polypeptide subunit release factors
MLSLPFFCFCLSFFFPSHVTASDVSAKALEVAKINVQGHPRITLVHSNLFEHFAAKQQQQQQAVPQFDLIVSNPPYVTKSVVAFLLFCFLLLFFVL